MSILPVSEALARLQDEGIAESQPRVGTRVRRPTALDVRELYEMREALECQTARLFSRAATARDRESLMEMALRVDELYNGLPQAGNDPDYRYTVMEHHARFHLRIAEVGKCFALYTALEKNQVLSFCWLYYNAAHRPAPPPHFHSEFVNELCSGDEEAADKAMREHVRHGVTEFARATMLEPVPVRQPVIPPLRQEFP
jgi:DNA-binding GntR family transcriptional regulator